MYPPNLLPIGFTSVRDIDGFETDRVTAFLARVNRRWDLRVSRSDPNLNNRTALNCNKAGCVGSVVYLVSLSG